MAHEPDYYNRSGLIAFVFSLSFVLLFFIYIVFIHPGVNLGELPNTVASAPVETKPALVFTEPWKDSPEIIDYGAKLYSTNCALCHGPKGLGDGAAGAALNPPPRNIVKGQWKQGGDRVSLFKTISGGISGSSMPAFGHFKKEDRWALVHFIQSITTDKTKNEDIAKIEGFAKSAK